MISQGALMILMNIYQAKTHFSQLIERVSQGEEVIIGKAGKPIAKLVPFHKERAPRKPGIWRGKVKNAKDFDELPPDLRDAFSGEKE